MNRPLSADRTWVRTVALTLLTALLTSAPALAQRRAITEKDLFAFVWIADPQISPDGSQVAFVKVSVDEKKDQTTPRSPGWDAS